MPVGAVGVLLGVWYGYPDLQKEICATGFVRTHDVLEKRCKAEFRGVDLAVATEVVDAFLRQVGGAKKTPARDLMTTELRAQIDEVRFKEDWPATVVAVERTSPLTPDSVPNQFTVTYRRFDVPSSTSKSKQVIKYTSPTGTVTRFEQKIRLRNSEHGPQIDAFVGSRRAAPAEGEGKRRGFGWASFLVQSATRRGPGLAWGLTPATDVRPGKGLRVLCVWPDEEGRNWYRTYLGWANGDHLELTHVPAEGILDCATDGHGTLRSEQ